MGKHDLAPRTFDPFLASCVRSEGSEYYVQAAIIGRTRLLPRGGGWEGVSFQGLVAPFECLVLPPCRHPLLTSTPRGHPGEELPCPVRSPKNAAPCRTTCARPVH